ATTPPRTSVTMPAITRITAKIQSNVAAPPVSARTPNMCPPYPADPGKDVPGHKGQDREPDDHDRRVLDRGVPHEPGTFRLPYVGRVCVLFRLPHPYLLGRGLPSRCAKAQTWVARTPQRSPRPGRFTQPGARPGAARSRSDRGRPAPPSAALTG